MTIEATTALQPAARSSMLHRMAVRVAELFAALDAARSCAAAVENHRYPAAADLRRLGIDPQIFARIRLS